MPAGKLYLSAPRKKYKKTKTVKSGRIRYLGGGPIPKTLQTKLKWTSIALGFVSGASVAPWTFRLNGLNDPDVTSGVDQPRAYDQMMALYTTYRVLGVRVKFEAVTYLTPYNMGLIVANSATAPALYRDYAENRKGKVKLCGIYQNPGVLRLKTSIANGIGVTASSIKNDDLYKALLNASPATQLYLHAMIDHPDGSTGTSINGRMHIEYDVLFENPVDVSIS